MNAMEKPLPMLSEKLSTNRTSLNVNEDDHCHRMVIGADGALQNANIDRARVCNHAQLAYHSVAAWLEGNDSLPEEVVGLNGYDANLRLQDRTTQRMKNFRFNDANQPISIATTERDITGRKQLERQDE